MLSAESSKLRLSDRYLRHRVQLRDVPTRRLHNNLELVRLQQRIVSELEAERARPLELLDQILLVLEDVDRNLGMDPHHERILLPLERRPPDGALDPSCHGLGGKHAPRSLAGWARLRHAREMALPPSLPGHFRPGLLRPLARP